MKKKLSVHDHESFKQFPFFNLQVIFFGVGGRGEAMSVCFKLRRCSDGIYAEFTKSIFVISNPVYVLQYDLRKFTAKGVGR